MMDNKDIDYLTEEFGKPSDTNFDKPIDTKHISNNHVSVQPPNLYMGKINKKLKEFLAISILKIE